MPIPMVISLSRATFLSISSGTSWTRTSSLGLIQTHSAVSAWSAKLMSMTSLGWPSAAARLTSLPSPSR